MADETILNGEFSDADSVEFTEDSDKTPVLTQKLGDLERENGKFIRQNEDYKQQIEELNASIKELSSENAEKKEELEELQSENNTFGEVAARAAELESEVWRLQQDLVSAMTDLQGSTVEISKLKRDLEGVKEREKEKDARLAVVVKERDLLLANVGKLEEIESSLRSECEGKEKEMQTLKKNLEELEVVIESNKVLEGVRSELEKTVEELKGKINVLEGEKVKISEKTVGGYVNGDDEGKGLIGVLKDNKWVVVLGGSTIAAVAVCYVHAARKH